MSSRDEERLEVLIGRLLGGDASESDPEVKEAMDDPSFRARLQQARAVARALDAGGAERRRVLARADELERAPGEASVEGSVRAWFDRRSSAPLSRRHLAAAAVLIAAGALLLWKSVGREDVPEDDVPLGPGEIRLESPAGEVEAFDAFRWTANLTGGRRCRVLVFDALTGDALLESPLLDGTAWEPDPGATASWEDVEWQVIVVDAAGDEVASDRWRVRRSP